MTKITRVGVIGAGRIGQLHMNNIRQNVPNASIVALVDVAFAHAQAVGKKLGIANVYPDPAPLFADDTIDAVLICSSTDTHAAFIEDAARAGKHIFCEKPIALDLATIDRALDAVEKAGVSLQIGFNRRFDPNFSEAKRLVDDGALGAVHIVRVTSRDPEPPPIGYVATSGGMFLDMSIHDFDMARFIAGSEVEEVYAVGSVLVDPAIGEAGDIDTAVVTLKFANGALGTIDNSRQAVYGYDQRLEVFGEKGQICVGNPKPHTAVLSLAQGDSTPPLLHFFLERYSDSFVAEMHAFINAIQQGMEPPVNGADGRAPVQIALAAKTSLNEGRPVKVSEISG
ncbi:inositol 2-dehydrogenase [Candidatus Bipolaricaulota bacterium]|nr:inositol 2-dehydrogenase [Candidatus Bipolaricaulota bacterium]